MRGIYRDNPHNSEILESISDKSIPILKRITEESKNDSRMESELFEIFLIYTGEGLKPSPVWIKKISNSLLSILESFFDFMNLEINI